MIKKYTIPTILGLLLLISGTLAGLFLIRNGQNFFLRASPQTTPTQIKVTNITDSSFTVSWLTESATTGFTNFGESANLGNVAADERDSLSGQTGSFYTHYVSFKNLKPKTKYYFKLSSGGKSFDQSGKPWETTTASTPLNPAPESDLASGTILKSDQTPAEGTIVYLSIANMTPQSSLVRTSGNWLIALNNAFTNDLTNFASYDKDASSVEIFVQGDKQTATAITTTKDDNPSGQIVLGENYDFRESETTTLTPTPSSEGGETATTSSQPTPTQEVSSSSKFSFQDLGEATSSKETDLSITNPEEGENINAQKPAFSGTGPAGQTLEILVESSTPYSDSIVVDSRGNWTWTPPENLAPGEHTITISYLGQMLTQRFVVLAAGESNLPSFTSTPSATLTPTVTATPTPRVSTTPTPTRIPTSTPTLRPTITTAPSATRTALPSTQSGVPSSGYLTPTFLVGAVGFILIFVGTQINRIKKILAHDRQ